jgi:GAF domain-containing protein
MKAAIPKNEAKRLQVLWQYNLLDTMPEEIFDELTELAGLICGAPISMITLVNERRQWFKSKVGVDTEENNRDVSICAHAILQKNLFIIPDATRDIRFKNNPLVTGKPKIRFYAGAPLVTHDGFPLGTLCVIDRIPRELTPAQTRAMQLLSRHVMALLEQRRNASKPTASKDDLKRMKTGLTKARKEIARLHLPKKAKKSRRTPAGK